MQLVRSRSLVVIAIGAAGLLGLSGCAAAGAEAPAKSQVEVEKPKADKPEKTDAPKDKAPESAGHAAWANPVTKPGELISTIEVGDVTVEVYQVGITQATKTGQFASPDGKPIIEVGADIVFVNYVITNNGDPIDLSSSLVNMYTRYDDWPYMGGMDSVVDSDLFLAQGVNDDTIGPDGYSESGIYTFETGAAYSVGANFLHQSNSPITFKASIVPVDASGDLLHDKRVEAEGTGTIQ